MLLAHSSISEMVYDQIFIRNKNLQDNANRDIFWLHFATALFRVLRPLQSQCTYGFRFPLIAPPFVSFRLPEIDLFQFPEARTTFSNEETSKSKLVSATSNADSCLSVSVNTCFLREKIEQTQLSHTSACRGRFGPFAAVQARGRTRTIPRVPLVAAVRHCVPDCPRRLRGRRKVAVNRRNRDRALDHCRNGNKWLAAVEQNSTWDSQHRYYAQLGETSVEFFVKKNEVFLFTRTMGALTFTGQTIAGVSGIAAACEATDGVRALGVLVARRVESVRTFLNVWIRKKDWH